MSYGPKYAEWSPTWYVYTIKRNVLLPIDDYSIFSRYIAIILRNISLAIFHVIQNLFLKQISTIEKQYESVSQWCVLSQLEGQILEWGVQAGSLCQVLWRSKCVEKHWDSKPQDITSKGDTNLLGALELKWALRCPTLGQGSQTIHSHINHIEGRLPFPFTSPILWIKLGGATERNWATLGSTYGPVLGRWMLPKSLRPRSLAPIGREGTMSLVTSDGYRRVGRYKQWLRTIPTAAYVTNWF